MINRAEKTIEGTETWLQEFLFLSKNLQLVIKIRGWMCCTTPRVWACFLTNLGCSRSELDESKAVTINVMLGD